MISLRLPYPPSVNHYWRHFRGRFVVSSEGKAYRVNVQAAFWEAYGLQAKPLTGRLGLSIECIMPDARTRDLDNLPKAICDSLAFAGVFVNDDQIDHLIVKRLHVEPPGAVDVIIEEL